MGRKKKIEYPQTTFAVRITELQKHYNYTDTYVCNNLLNENGAPLITEEQTLNNYKTGKRLPRDFYEVIIAFAKFYHVTTDYLLGYDNVPNRNVEKVTTYTGLSSDAVNKLVKLKKISPKYPGILEMIDALLVGSSSSDILLLINLYNRIYNDYKDEKLGNTESNYELEKMQRRFLETQQLYEHIKMLTTQKLSATFDKQILQDEDEENYYHSQEYINNLPEIEDCDYNLISEDGKIEHLSPERYTNRVSN